MSVARTMSITIRLKACRCAVSIFSRKLQFGAWKWGGGKRRKGERGGREGREREKGEEGGRGKKEKEEVRAILDLLVLR